VIRADEQIGTVRVAMTKAQLEAEVARQWSQAVLTGFLQLLLGLVLVLPLLRVKVLDPIGRLVGQSQALAAGDWRQPFFWQRADELGALGRSFEAARQSLARLFGDLRERNRDLAKREAELAAQAAILRATLDNMTDGICLFDDDLRMRICNQRFVEIMQFPPEITREGISLEAMIRFDIDRGKLNAPDPDGYVEQALARYRSGGASETTLERGGAVLRLRRRPVADGGFVTTYTDVTDQKRHEERLALLATAVEQEGDSVDREFIFFVPAFPLEDIYDPTGAGDSFAGGFLGSLAGNGEVSNAGLRRAVVYGSAMGSFAVEKFSIDGLLNISRSDISGRVRDFHRMVSFEQDLG
jgi:PAS domain-containing protein